MRTLILGFFTLAALAWGVGESINLQKNRATAHQPEEFLSANLNAIGKQEGYLEYSKEIFEESSAKKRVLFFYSNYCVTCVPADKIFKDNINKIPKDVVLIRVDFNDANTNIAEKDLAEQYKVVDAHTLIRIDQNGKELSKWNGGDIEELINQIR